jgi:hypothetical protein
MPVKTSASCQRPICPAIGNAETLKWALRTTALAAGGTAARLRALG